MERGKGPGGCKVSNDRLGLKENSFQGPIHLPVHLSVHPTICPSIWILLGSLEVKPETKVFWKGSHKKGTRSEQNKAGSGRDDQGCGQTLGYGLHHLAG